MELIPFSARPTTSIWKNGLTADKVGSRQPILEIKIKIYENIGFLTSPAQIRSDGIKAVTFKKG